MKKRKAAMLRNGLYQLWWKDGGSSFAAVGSLCDGAKWFAPINWVSASKSGIASTRWSIVKHADMIDSVEFLGGNKS